ncbi:DUF2254 domain-containing protein [Pseudooceanicola sp. HF7]|uniref:DUF2254 domain-containing protein n=1 Tax=Pseudooceanicola sp. HF7 TaxID=2721560 RepID=UPI00142F6A1E|nr:DUF2254 domain-containing protein [Pseudooceanicola sp. HF7]NIZ08669.1 DUF2254 domain-containing protein [Pseudooceanicola sp. HF7]
MLPSLLRKIHEFSRRLVVRVLLIAALAVLAVGLTKLMGQLIPIGLDGLVGAEAVDRILSVIANSMLAVTTFSLTAMTAAHRNVMSLWTPRAHQVLLEDTTTHTVLATFVGAYLYALLAIILREMDLFDTTGIVVLFAMTILVVLLIVAAIIRWISHLELFGSLIGTAETLEGRTQTAFHIRARYPSLGAHPLKPAEVPDQCIDVAATDTGYVTQIYQDLLQDAAKKAGGHIWLMQPVGAFVVRGQLLARIDSQNEDLLRALRENIEISELRNFTQDPEFGFISLSEIGVRALSPSVNDPGTAVDMLRRMTRVLMSFDEPMDGRGHELQHDRLYVPALDREEMIRRAFAPLLRDGAGMLELQTPVAEVMGALSHHPDPVIAAATRALHASWKEGEAA